MGTRTDRQRGGKEGIFVYIYIYVYVYIYIYIYAYICVYVYIYIYIYNYQEGTEMVQSYYDDREKTESLGLGSMSR